MTRPWKSSVTHFDDTSKSVFRRSLLARSSRLGFDRVGRRRSVRGETSRLRRFQSGQETQSRGSEKSLVVGSIGRIRLQFPSVREELHAEDPSNLRTFILDGESDQSFASRRTSQLVSACSSGDRNDRIPIGHRPLPRHERTSLSLSIVDSILRIRQRLRSESKDEDEHRRKGKRSSFSS